MPPNLIQDLDVLRVDGEHGHRDERIRCAILGCGMMGQEHISYIAGYPQQIRIDYLCDPHQPSLDRSLRVWHSFDKSEGALAEPKLLHDEQQLLDQHGSDIDLLVIATPNYQHTDTLLRWASMDVTILCEKPVAVSQEQHDVLAEQFLRQQSMTPRLWIAMEYRFIPAVAQLLHLIPTVVGDIRMVTIRENRYPFLHKIGKWNRSPALTGDTLVEKCCHFFDLFRLLTGNEVDLPRVKAMAQRGINYRDEEEPANGQEPIIDAAYCMFPMKSASDNPEVPPSRRSRSTHLMACLELCMYAEGSRHQEEIIVTGTKGRLEAYLPENKVYAFRRPTQEEWSDRSVPPPQECKEAVVFDCSNVNAVHGIQGSIPTHDGYHYSSTAVEWYRLLQAIQVHKETGIWKPDVSLSDGLAAVQIGLQATRALEDDM